MDTRDNNPQWSRQQRAERRGENQRHRSNSTVTQNDEPQCREVRHAPHVEVAVVKHEDTAQPQVYDLGQMSKVAANDSMGQVNNYPDDTKGSLPEQGKQSLVEQDQFQSKNNPQNTTKSVRSPQAHAAAKLEQQPEPMDPKIRPKDDTQLHTVSEAGSGVSSKQAELPEAQQDHKALTSFIWPDLLNQRNFRATSLNQRPLGHGAEAPAALQPIADVQQQISDRQQRSRDSRQSKHSRSDGMSTSLEKFRQAIPKKEYKNDISEGQDVQLQNFSLPKTPVAQLGVLLGNQQKLRKAKLPAPVVTSNAFIEEPAGDGTSSRGLDLNEARGSRLTNNLQALLANLKSHSIEHLLSEVEKINNDTHTPTQMSQSDQLAFLLQKIADKSVTPTASRDVNHTLPMIGASGKLDSQLVIDRKLPQLRQVDFATNANQLQSRSSKFSLQNPILKQVGLEQERADLALQNPEVATSGIPLAQLMALQKSGGNQIQSSGATYQQKMWKQQLTSLQSQGQTHSNALQNSSGFAVPSPQVMKPRVKTGLSLQLPSASGAFDLYRSEPSSAVKITPNDTGATQNLEKQEATPSSDTAPNKLLNLLQSYLQGSQGQVATQLTGLEESAKDPIDAQVPAQVLPQQTQVQTEVSQQQPKDDNLQNMLSFSRLDLIQKLISMQQGNENAGLGVATNHQTKDAAVNSSLSGNLAGGSGSSKGFATSGSRQSKDSHPGTDELLKHPKDAASKMDDSGASKPDKISSGQESRIGNGNGVSGNSGPVNSTDKEDPSSGLDLVNLRAIMDNYKPPLQSHQISQLHQAMTKGATLSEPATQNALQNLLQQAAKNAEKQQNGQNSINLGQLNALNPATAGSQQVNPQGQMRYNGPTSSSENDDGARGAAQNIASNNLTGSNVEEIAKDNSDLGANTSVAANPSTKKENNLALVKHIRWQEQELSRLKTLILLQSLQQIETSSTKSQTNWPRTESNQPLLSSAPPGTSTEHNNALQFNRQGQLAQSPWTQIKTAEQPQRVNGSGMSDISAVIKSILGSQTTTADSQVSGQLNPQLMTILKMAGINIPEALIGQKQSLLGKRTLDQVKGLETEQAVRQEMPAAQAENTVRSRFLNQMGLLNQQPQSDKMTIINQMMALQNGQSNANAQRPSDMKASEANAQSSSISTSRALLANLAASLGKQANSAMQPRELMITPRSHLEHSSHLDSKMFVSNEADNQSDDERCQTQLLKIKHQLHANLDRASYEQYRFEISNCIKQQKVQGNMEGIVVEAKPKRLHAKVGGNGFRGSQFRGVSKNKFKWQMMIMINQRKVYLGAIKTENIAARFYDYIAILSQGLNAKTNFSYSALDLCRIMKMFGRDDEAPIDFGVGDLRSLGRGRSGESMTNSALPGIEHPPSAYKRQRLSNNSDESKITPDDNLREDLILASQLYNKEGTSDDALPSHTETTQQAAAGSVPSDQQKEELLQQLLLLKQMSEKKIEDQNQQVNPMSWSLIYNYAMSMAKAEKSNGPAPAAPIPDLARQNDYKTPVRKRDSSDDYN